MKKFLSLVLLVALLICCTACSGGDQKAEETAAPTQTIEETPEEAPEETAQTSTGEDGEGEEMAAGGDFTWQIELRGAEVKESLHTDAGVPQYDGEVLDVAFDNEPTEGYKFLILTLTVTKNAAGGGAFKWENLSVVDADGNTYSRMENDSFLDSHAYKRMAGTALQIGENKGSICFEIPVEVADGTLTLRYDAGEEGINEISIQ